MNHLHNYLYLLTRDSLELLVHLIIFQNGKISFYYFTSKIVADFQDHYVDPPPSLVHYLIPPSTIRDCPVGLFDATTQYVQCSARMVIFQVYYHFYQLWMDRGIGKNTRGNLVSFWGHLLFSKTKSGILICFSGLSGHYLLGEGTRWTISYLPRGMETKSIGIY